MEELIRILIKWIKPILIVCAIAAIGSAIVSMMMKEYYTSNALFQVSNPHMMDRGNLFTEELKGTVYLFGGKADVDRCITLANSRALQESVINKFNLYEHYDIDKKDPESGHWVSFALQGHFKITKTTEGMLTVSVQDEDPQFAAEMANYIVYKLDTLNKKIITEKKRDLSTLYEKEVKTSQQRVATLTDSLRRAIERNPEDTVTASILGQMAENAVEQFNKVNTIAKEHSSALNQPFSTIYWIEKAVPAVKRSWPVRSLIVVSSTLLAGIAMVFLAIFMEKFREFKLEEE